MFLTTLAVLTGLFLWPFALYTANLPVDFLNYITPPALLLVSYFFYKKEKSYYFFPLLAIPFFQPKLAVFPLIFSIILLIWKRTKINLVFLLLSLAVLFINIQSFYGQTIFVPDYEARQEVIRDTQLYDSVFMARLFHNKLRIVIDKFNSNFFALLDPGNYFFGFHPRQIIGNQNLSKYPFFGLVFLLYGLFFTKKEKSYKFMLLSFIAGVLSLSLLSIFDRNDFILWAPLGIIFVNGVHQFRRRVSFSKIYFVIYLVYTIPEYIRILLAN